MPIRIPSFNSDWWLRSGGGDAFGSAGVGTSGGVMGLARMPERTGQYWDWQRPTSIGSPNDPMASPPPQVDTPFSQTPDPFGDFAPTTQTIGYRPPTDTGVIGAGTPGPNESWVDPGMIDLTRSYPPDASGSIGMTSPTPASPVSGAANVDISSYLGMNDVPLPQQQAVDVTGGIGLTPPSEVAGSAFTDYNQLLGYNDVSLPQAETVTGNVSGGITSDPNAGGSAFANIDPTLGTFVMADPFESPTAANNQAPLPQAEVVQPPDTSNVANANAPWVDPSTVQLGEPAGQPATTPTDTTPATTTEPTGVASVPGGPTNTNTIVNVQAPGPTRTFNPATGQYEDIYQQEAYQQSHAQNIRLMDWIAMHDPVNSPGQGDIRSQTGRGSTATGYLDAQGNFVPTGNIGGGATYRPDLGIGPYNLWIHGMGPRPAGVTETLDPRQSQRQMVAARGGRGG